MGVPLRYRWLSERYPLINRPASSPPFAEVDNLYGILHTTPPSRLSLPTLSGRLPKCCLVGRR